MKKGVPMIRQRKPSSKNVFSKTIYSGRFGICSGRFGINSGRVGIYSERFGIYSGRFVLKDIFSNVSISQILKSLLIITQKLQQSLKYEERKNI